MEQHDFVNIYIQQLVVEVEELTKTKVLGAAREKFKDSEIGELKDRIVELEENTLKEKDEVAQTWKLALSEKDAQHQSVQDEKETRINQITTQMDGLHRELKDREATIKELNAKVEDLKIQLKEKKLNSKESDKETAKTKPKKVANATLLLIE